MDKKEVAEIKKQFTSERCPISRICGCYVDADKQVRTQFQEAFLSLPEEDFFKYLAIFQKSMSGTLGKNLLSLDFPLESEKEGGAQERLLQLKYSGLQDDGLLEEFYEQVIASFDCEGHYLILLGYGVYDIPGKSLDNLEMFDASDEVYEHIVCCICPVNLSKPGLSYHEKDNCFASRDRDWIVEMPAIGFLFPAFCDRSADIHSALYYTKKPEKPQAEVVEQVLGCTLPLTAGDQKETFQALVRETLGETCDYDTVRTIHENLNELIEEQIEEPAPLVLGKEDVKRLLERSGVAEEKLAAFDDRFEEEAGEEASFVAENVANMRKFEIKARDIVVQVNPMRSDLVETTVIDGRKCLVIVLTEDVEVNGIAIR